ncbi:probable ATP-dependent RNA helicase DHX37 [Aplysia californica]|uniref:Probable ATP-dependent RNA helicase DHX37 n=1 Tax=Aplysia californica TaxID=6500 RepID=A0ABM0K1H5_APLCA|nr:probable ATP-dependent RNA helicase DHX37 [Aplysia californica]
MGKRKVHSGTQNNNDVPDKPIVVEGMEHSVDPGDSNMLVVVPSKKKKEAKVPVVTTKKLSKKERKRLTDIVKRKEQKERRAELLESLAKHQATEEEMKNFTSITEVYSQNFKSDPSMEDTFEMKANSIRGSKKKKKLQTPKPEQMEADSTDTDDISTDEEVERTMAEAEEAQVDKPGTSDADSVAEAPDSRGCSEETKMEQDEKVPQTGDVTQTAEKSKDPPKPAVFIPLNRKPEMQEGRLKLPILAEEQVVMEAINENPVVIICGETGSGKTTQVPQFLYEAGYAHGKGIIGVTEPRRVAAISMSRRVATEMNLTSRDVSYQIRFEGNVTPDTRVKFLTDGVLLKEAQQDPLLSRYSVIIIDEAHERSVYTDILVGLLSIVVRQREKRGRPLKLIVMSATLRVEDFTGPSLFKYSKPPPIIKVDARQFPVTIHFNKRTVEDYVTEAYRKVCKIHRTLPEGGILVFVTGQQEVHTLAKKLRRLFPYSRGQGVPEKGKKQSRRERKKEKEKAKEEKEELSTLPEVSLDSYSVLPQDDEEAEMQEREAEDVPGDFEDDEEGDDFDEEMRERMEEDKPDSSIPLFVLPLYSLLSSEKQALVFEPPPEGCRLCVIATNVAETSLTIPNVRYVVDTGKTKTKFYDKVTGVSTFRVTWVSQASADQRAGRAGRMGPGHCYRLYSSAVFSDFTKFSPPEISRRPVEDLVLQMKSMRIDKVLNFPFPTPPDPEQIKAAETVLVSLGALRKSSASNRLKDIRKGPSPVITEVGAQMAAFPVSPRYAKMLLLGRQFKVMPYVVALVSALSVDEVFENSIQPSDLEDKEQLKAKTNQLNVFRSKLVGNALLLGDMMVLLTAVGACEAEGCSPAFCHQLGIRVKAMKEIRKLRLHLTNAANIVFPEDDMVVNPRLAPPSDEQTLALRKVVLGGLADHVARRSPGPPPGADKAEVKRLKGAFQCTQLEEPAYIHPESSLFRNTEVEFVVYQSMLETSRLYMRGLCCVEPHWFPELAPSHCLLSKALEEPAPRFDADSGTVRCHRSGSFGRCNWEFPATEMEFPDSVECFRWFAKFLLDGEVFPQLQRFKSSLTLAPATMVKSWAKLQPRTERFLKALLSQGCNTRAALAKVWETSPKFLQREYLEWVKESEHAEVMTSWPPT